MASQASHLTFLALNLIVSKIGLQEIFMLQFIGASHVAQW